jgi:GNAT superfamily N-acetyltransferase
MSDDSPLAGVHLRRVEEVGLNALQTQRQLFYDGWLLRVSPGKAKRARSVNAHFGSSLPLAQKIPYCERIYAERGLPALFRITPFAEPHGLEDELAARGYQSFEETLVQLTRLVRPPELPAVPGVDFVAPSPAAFADAVGELQQSSAEQRVALLERLAHTPLATRAMIAVADGQPVGTGTVVLEDGLAGVYSMVTAPGMRTRGIASGILATLLGWAWERGATHAYLQVSADNHRAISVYRRFGFADAYAYHYRGRPDECR